MNKILKPATFASTLASTILLGLGLTVVLSGCNVGDPSTTYLKRIVVDKMNIYHADQSVVEDAGKATVKNVNCPMSGEEKVCTFDILDRHYTIPFVKTGSGDWSPRLSPGPIESTPLR